MECSTETMLLEDYVQATSDYFDASEKLASLVGQHSQFDDEKENVAHARAKCDMARLALLNHREQHGCCAGSRSLTHHLR